MYLTQGKLRENTGNFISAAVWPPWTCSFDVSVLWSVSDVCESQLQIAERNKVICIKKLEWKSSIDS